jgi:hypothetical protein
MLEATLQMVQIRAPIASPARLTWTRTPAHRVSSARRLATPNPRARAVLVPLAQPGCTVYQAVGVRQHKNKDAQTAKWGSSPPADLRSAQHAAPARPIRTAIPPRPVRCARTGRSRSVGQRSACLARRARSTTTETQALCARRAWRDTRGLIRQRMRWHHVDSVRLAISTRTWTVSPRAHGVQTAHRARTVPHV